jgi:hypothetical protein
MGEGRLLPISFNIRNKPGTEDEIDLSFAKDLIGNMDVAALGISGAR